MRKYNFSKFILPAACTLLLAACGEENSTEVTESTGLSTIAAGESMPKCDSEVAGQMVYAADSAAIYYCSEGKWSMLNGQDGADGSVANGTSCSAKVVKEGLEISCAGVAVDTLTSATDAKLAKQGNSCSIKQNDTKSGVILTCETEEGVKSYEITGNNGSDCSAVEKDGVITVSCGGEVFGTLTSAKSAYDIAVEEGFVGDEAAWLESLKGKNCTAADYTDPEDETKTGIQLTCEGDKGGIVWNGATGETGAGCSIKDNGDATISVTCGKTKKRTVTLYKAVCGMNAYDPQKSFCQNGRSIPLCNGNEYDYNTTYCSNGTVLKDYGSLVVDGEKYKTVVIKTENYEEEWLAENVRKFTQYSRCYNDDPYECDTYGRLYTWEEAQSVCPEGWRLPSEDDWNSLFTAVGGTTDAGKMLKSAYGWYEGGNGTNAFGFNALPAGEYRDDRYRYEGEYVNFWSSYIEESTHQMFSKRFSTWSDEISPDTEPEWKGPSLFYSVRCLKNKASNSQD